MIGRRCLRLIASLVSVGMGFALGIGPVLVAGAATQPELAAARVVVVGVPGLLWGDVASGIAAELTDLASHAGLGDMTVRAARSRTCILDGLATLGAGNRARYPAPTLDSVEHPTPLTPEEQALRMATLSGCGQQEQVARAGLTDVSRTVARIADDDGTRAFGAEPGVLGVSVNCSTAIGRASAVALAGPTAQVSIVDQLPTDPDQIAAAMSRCPLTIITLPDLIGTVPSVSFTGPVPSGIGSTDGSDVLEPARSNELLGLDRAVGSIRAAIDSLPGKTLLLVAGLSEKGVSRSQLHPLIAVHPDLTLGYLNSASTGRAPYVQLIDVAPTVLRALGVSTPDSMVGSPMRWAGPADDLPTALSQLRDLNRAAVAHSGLTRTFFWTLVLVAGALVAWLVVARIRRNGRIGPALSLSALALAALPAATELANLTPWWRSPSRELALGLSVLAYVIVLMIVSLTLGSNRAAASRLLPSERSWAGPALVILVVTALTFGGDVVLGSPMELNGLLGYNAIVAGRFVGLGNLSFGLLAVSALLSTAVLVRGTRRVRLLGIAIVGVITVTIVGAAGLGRDFGGVLALVPGFLLLGFLSTRTRLSVRRVLGIGAIAVVAVSAFALADYQRGPDDRTHLGRFVAQLLDGQAWTVISRKAQANLDVLTGSPVTWLLPIFAVAALVLLWRQGPLGQVLAAEPGWRSGLVAALVAVFIGAVINDSGVAIPAIAGCVVVPVVIWLTARWPGSGTESGSDTPAGGAGSQQWRVSVNSREPNG